MGVAQFTAGQSLTALEVNQLPVIVSYLATGSVSNSTAETVIGTFTIPAGDPTSPGGYQYYALITCAEAGGTSLLVRMRLGTVTGTQIGGYTSAITFNSTPGAVDLHGFVALTAIGSAGTLDAVGYGGQNILGAGAGQFGPFYAIATAINTTIANNIVITAQFGNASVSNTATAQFGSLYRL